MKTVKAKGPRNPKVSEIIKKNRTNIKKKQQKKRKKVMRNGNRIANQLWQKPKGKMKNGNRKRGTNRTRRKIPKKNLKVNIKVTIVNKYIYLIGMQKKKR